MFDNLILQVIKNIWPMLFIFTTIIVSIRLSYVIINKEKIIFYKEILMLCFIIYILLLYYIVTFQDESFGTNNFIPFKEILRYDVGNVLFYKNVIGNMILFVPFGLFVSYYIKNNHVFTIIILSTITSCAIEFAQTAIGRTCDVDDVILNTAGGVLGYFIFKLFSKIGKNMPSIFRNEVFLDALTLGILFTLIFLSFKYNIWRWFS